MHSAELLKAFEKIGKEMERFHGQAHDLEHRTMGDLRANEPEETEFINHLHTLLGKNRLRFRNAVLDHKDLESYLRGAQETLCTRAAVRNVLKNSELLVELPLVETLLRKYANVVLGRAFPRKVIIED